MVKIVTLADASKEQLRNFASRHLGIEFDTDATAAQMEAKIRTCIAKDTIEIDEPDEAVTVAASTADAPKGDMTVSGQDPKVRLSIHESDSAGGKRAVPAGVNGNIMLLPRNQEIEIPYRYYLALKDAVESRWFQNSETDELVENKVPSYAYSVLQMPSQEEVDRWHRADQGIAHKDEQAD